VQLAHDNPLGPIDHEGPVLGHQRDFAEVNLLLLHVLDRTCTGSAGPHPNDQLDSNLEGGGIRHAPLVALVDRILRLAEAVAHEFERGCLVEILDGEDRAEDALQTGVSAFARWQRPLQEFFIRAFLDFDEVGNFDDLLDPPKASPKTQIIRYLRTHCDSLVPPTRPTSTPPSPQPLRSSSSCPQPAPWAPLPSPASVRRQPGPWLPSGRDPSTRGRP